MTFTTTLGLLMLFIYSGIVYCVATWFFLHKKYKKSLVEIEKKYSDKLKNDVKELEKAQIEVMAQRDLLNQKYNELSLVEESYLTTLNSPWARNVDRRAMANTLYDTLAQSGIDYEDFSRSSDDYQDEEGFSDPDPMSEFTGKKNGDGGLN